MSNTPQIDPSDQPRFKIKKWTAVGLWSWDLDSADCAICKSNLMEPCVDCQNDAQNTQQQDKKFECITATGDCGHSFHLHCINKWLSKRNVCPLDSQPWEFKKYNK
jgi:E3 ubiquitin-protein ligase RBX1